MPEARQIAAWFAVVGIALTVQGCWEEEQDRLTLLGDGGCRTIDDRHGAFTTVSGVSLDHCQAQCFNGNGPCAAVEYITHGGNCEIHSEPITKYEEMKGVACYVTE